MSWNKRNYTIECKVADVRDTIEVKILEVMEYIGTVSIMKATIKNVRELSSLTFSLQLKRFINTW